MKPKSEMQGQAPSSRKSYKVPKLTNYGRVQNLTQTGSMGRQENSNMNGCSSNSSRRPCSERFVKENIVRIGEHPLGFGLYLFDYRPEYRGRWGYGRQFGVMIDEVETVVPEAVFIHPDGYKRSITGFWESIV